MPLQPVAVFIDRDGVLIEDRDYLSRAEDVAFFSGTGDALRKLSEARFQLFMVTNQSGVGRGYFTMKEVAKVHEHIETELAQAGVRFQRIYVAPEAPGQPSRGRKPSPQFLFDARDEFGIALEESFMIGDKLIDLECGWNAGVKQTILVRTGYGRELEQTAPTSLRRALIVDHLAAAVDWILKPH